MLKRIPEARVPRLVSMPRHGDTRGWFAETYNQRVLHDLGISCRFVQDNHSFSHRLGTIRGLHFQKPPMAQAKLVRVIQGSIVDVAVDIRVGSPTYGRFVSHELSALNGLQLFIPVGFAHGFCTLEDATEVMYKVSNYYAPACEGGIRFDDAKINISWPVRIGECVLSEKDARLPNLDDLLSPFVYADNPLQLPSPGL